MSIYYLLAKFGFDRAENELSKVCRGKQAIPTPGHKSGSAYCCCVSVDGHRFFVGFPGSARKGKGGKVYAAHLKKHYCMLDHPGHYTYAIQALRNIDILDVAFYVLDSSCPKRSCLTLASKGDGRNDRLVLLTEEKFY